MDKDDILKQVNDLLDERFKERDNKSLEFRRWNPLDSVTDQFSPITGASQMIGFFGKSKISKPTVTGSKGANAALTSLLTALSNLGLVVDSSS